MLDWGSGAVGGGGRRRQAAAAIGATAPASGAAPAACWYAEELVCGSREGAVSSEDRGVAWGGARLRRPGNRSGAPPVRSGGPL
jgi:hypothetical protein